MLLEPEMSELALIRVNQKSCPEFMDLVSLDSRTLVVEERWITVRKLVMLVAVVALTLSVVATAGAQTFLMNPMPVDQPRVGFRFLHPSLDNPYVSIGTFSGAYELYGFVPVSPKWGMAISIPYAHASKGNPLSRRTSLSGFCIAKSSFW